MPFSPPLPGTALVIAVDPARVGEEKMGCLSALEREQAARFRFEKDATRWRACRTALRTVVGESLGISPAAVTFEFGEFGKPALPPSHPLHFNLSHCRDLALIVLCPDGEVGIDIEPRDRATSLLGCEDAFCHTEEIAALPVAGTPRADALLEIWTAKEALLKAVGTGMSLPPQSVPVARHADDPRFRGFRLHRLEEPALKDYFACLAAPESVARVEVVRWPD